MQIVVEVSTVCLVLPKTVRTFILHSAYTRFWRNCHGKMCLNCALVDSFSSNIYTICALHTFFTWFCLIHFGGKIVHGLLRYILIERLFVSFKKCNNLYITVHRNRLQWYAYMKYPSTCILMRTKSSARRNFYCNIVE